MQDAMKLRTCGGAEKNAGMNFVSPPGFESTPSGAVHDVLGLASTFILILP